MLRYPRFRPSHHLPLIIRHQVFPNQKTCINKQSCAPTGNTLRARLFQILCSCRSKQSITPRSNTNLQLVASTDPQNIVVIASASAGSSEDGGFCPSAFDRMQSDIEGTYERHTASLLDGLATICVHQPNSQVLAVAMQIDHVSKRIRFTVAGNDNVSKETVQHLKVVWEILQEISSYSERHLAGDENPTRKQEGKRDEEPLSKAKDPALLWRLQHVIYQFSSKKLLSNFDAQRPELQKLAIDFKGIRTKPDQVSNNATVNQVGEALIGIFDVIEYTLTPLFQKLKDTNRLEDYEWKTLCVILDGILYDYEKFLDGDKGPCEEWIAIAKRAGRKRSPKTFVQVYLQKLTSLPRHIRKLVRSAQSHHLRPNFVKELLIHHIPAERTKRVLPTTPGEWKELIVSIAHRHGYKILKSISSKNFPNQHQGKVGKVHCECLLVKYFHCLRHEPELDPTSWSNVTPFSYIGVSKPSCQGCSSWLKAYNTLGQQPFYTQGTHPGWFSSWGMPQLGNEEEMEQVRKAMADDTARKYCLIQRGRGNMALLSGGTGPPPIENGTYSLGSEENTLYAAAKDGAIVSYPATGLEDHPTSEEEPSVGGKAKTGK